MSSAIMNEFLVFTANATLITNTNTQYQCTRVSIHILYYILTLLLMTRLPFISETTPFTKSSSILSSANFFTNEHVGKTVYPFTFAHSNAARVIAFPIPFPLSFSGVQVCENATIFDFGSPTCSYNKYDCAPFSSPVNSSPIEKTPPNISKLFNINFPGKHFTVTVSNGGSAGDVVIVRGIVVVKEVFSLSSVSTFFRYFVCACEKTPKSTSQPKPPKVVE